ncbi:MAG TPA: class I SAM-dependent methyltransferase [Tepidisphaeraceae bacterium]|jgi:hypothetical protein
MTTLLDRPLKISTTGSGLRYVDITDQFVNWLSYANAGMLNRGNLYCIDYALRELPSDAPMMEIGSFCGLSTNLISYYRQKHGRPNRLITCDKWIFEGSEEPMLGDTAITHEEYRAFVRETFQRNVKMFSRDELPFTVEAFSDEFFPLWRKEQRVEDVFGRPVQLGGRISFAFIDGNHSYDYALRDFENVDEFLEPGGFILFDDSADGSKFEVGEVAKEVAAGSTYEVVMKNPNYFFRKK